MLIKRGLGNEVFLKVKFGKFSRLGGDSIELLINVNLRYMYPARYLHLLFWAYGKAGIRNPEPETETELEPEPEPELKLRPG